MTIDEEDHGQRDEGDENFAKDADEYRTPALADEIAQAGAQADSRKGRKKSPLRKISE